MTPEGIKEYKENHHHHIKDFGPLHKARAHECELDANSANPLSDCRNKYPPQITSRSYAPYDITRPATPSLVPEKKEKWTIPASGLMQMPLWNSFAQEKSDIEYIHNGQLWMKKNNLI